MDDGVGATLMLASVLAGPKAQAAVAANLRAPAEEQHAHAKEARKLLGLIFSTVCDVKKHKLGGRLSPDEPVMDATKFTKFCKDCKIITESFGTTYTGKFSHLHFSFTWIKFVLTLSLVPRCCICKVQKPG